MEIYIAGRGIISSIGKNVEETLASLKQLKTGVGDITVFHTHHAGALPAAEVKTSNKELAALNDLDPEFSRTALLSIIAAKEAVADAAIPDLKKWRVGFLSANTVGWMDKKEDFMTKYLANPEGTDVSEAVYHDTGAVTEIVADRLGIKDYVTTISTACSSSANSIMYGARLIKNDILDIAIAGGTDAMSRFTLNGFNALMILDNKPCTPYDEHRKGLNLGEGAAYVVLVSEKVATGLKKKPEVKLSGYANANDAFHQTASSPEGKGNFLAMKGALEMSGLNTKDIDYINLHGTGTVNNDVSEGTAIERIFGNNIPKASSTKTFTGHTLGACGAVEAVFSILAIERNVIFPHLRFSTRMKELNFSPVTEFMENVKVNHVLSNSFGFGGNCSSLIFSRVN